MKYKLSDKQERTSAWDYLNKLTGQEAIVEIKLIRNNRTTRQNSAIHKYYELLAEELNNAGLSMMKVLKAEAEIPWTSNSVKEHLWRPIQVAQLDKESTTDLNTKEIGEIYETLNRYIGEKLGVHVAFPSMDELYYERGNYE